MTIEEILINLLTHVFKLKSDRPKTPEKLVTSTRKEKADKLKSEKKNPPRIVVQQQPVKKGDDGHKSIGDAVAEGLILDPTPFKNEGNLDAKTPNHSKFGEELQRIIENPFSNSSETSGSSCSEDTNNEAKRVVVHPSQCKIFETTNQVTESMSSH